MRGKKCLGVWTRGIAFLGVGISTLLGSVAQAAPVAGKEYTLRQPDGAPVQVRIWGDEYYQHIESLDGYTLILDSGTNEICYAKPTADRSDIESTGLRVGAKGLLKLGVPPHVRPARKVIETQVAEARASIAGPLKSARIPKAAPTTGSVAGICIIVDFSDSPGTIARTEVNNFCNQIGYAGYGNNGSVRDYYLSVSGGQLDYTNYVHTFSGTGGYFRAPKPKSYYDDPSVAEGQRAVELITAALNAMNATVNFANYDGDGDGYVDAVNCFYAGQRTSQWATGLWPHQGGMTWYADGVTVNAYQITDMSDELTMATFCHENGHLVMDWPDLYDYDYDSNGVGDFCLMGYGGAEKNPVQPCAPLKIAAGWGSTVSLAGQQSGLVSTAGSNVFHRFDNPNNSAECFVVENRQATDRDASLPDSGLAVWHVDTNGSNNWNEQLPTRHFLVTLVQADGAWHLENDINYGDANDFWSAPYKTVFGAATNPNSNWWNGTASDFELSSIGASGATMTFDFNQPTLQVQPVTNFNAVGPVGGPFSPSSNAYTLTNFGTGSLSWTATSNQPWLTVTPASGALGGGSSVTVQASVNGAASSLAVGGHEATVTFTNNTAGRSSTRTVLLRVGSVDDCAEWFQSSDNDLDNTSITFTPDAEGNSYTACRTSADSFPTSISGSTVLTLNDDDSANVSLTGGQQLSLYGRAYSSVYIGSNGYVNFAGPDQSGYEADLVDFFSLPRVAGLMDDLDPGAGGTVSYAQLSDRFVVTYLNVPIFNTSNSNSFQIELFFDKTIRITWLGLGHSGGIAGLSAGEGTPSGFIESNFSGYNACPAPIIVTALTTNAPDPTREARIPVTVSFSEPVTGFTSGDIDTVNGTVSGFAGSGASYSFDLMAAGQGWVSASIPAGVATGLSGDTNAAASIGRTYDSVPPSIAIGAPTPAVTAHGPATYTVTYTGATSITLDNTDIVLNGSNADGTANVTGTGSTRTVTISNVSGNGTISFSILAGSAADPAGNLAPSAGPSPALTVDNTSISVNIGPPSVAATRNGPVTYSVRYDNVSSVSLVAGNIALNRTGTANATIGVVAAKAEGTQTRLVTLSNITGSGTLGISIAPGTARDSLNAFAPAAGPSATFAVDGVAPVLTLRGGDVIAVEINTAFTDPGASAYDAVDGDLSSQVVVDRGGLDTTTVGQYVLTYAIQDMAGNTATARRTVVVAPVGEAVLPLMAWPTALALAAIAGIKLRRGRRRP